jgi:hypothetical protein
MALMNTIQEKLLAILPTMVNHTVFATDSARVSVPPPIWTMIAPLRTAPMIAPDMVLVL